jgi:hypothetical protein
MRALGWMGGALGAASVLAAMYACSSGSNHGKSTADAGDDAGVDAPDDVNVGPMPACVKSPTPAPFPSGACNAPKPPQPDAVDEALARAGTDRCGLSMAWVGKCFMPATNPERMPDFTALQTDPLRLPAYGAETAAWFDTAIAGPTPVASAIGAAAARRGTPVTACADPAWSVVQGADAAPLASVLGEIAASVNDTNFDPQAAMDAVSGVPLDLQQALVPIVRAIGYGYADVLAARQPASAQLKALAETPAVIIGDPVFDATTAPFTWWDKVDVGKMALVASRIATAVETASLSRFAGRNVPTVEIGTDFGNVVLHGSGVDTYLPKSMADGAALVLDTGGDDIYRVPMGAATLAHGVSVSIDLGGKDLYSYVEKPYSGDDAGHRLPSDGAPRYGATQSRTPREGAGVLGVGLLFDYGGDDDTYRSLAVSQGLGVLGVGVLYDDGGNESYACETLCQGAAGWGIGLLLDRAGTDSYLSYNEAQGFGFTHGVGVLVDEAGNDTYYADPGDPTLGGDSIYPNAQLPGPPPALTGNTSFVQGAGYGWRPDVPFAGHPSPGGMGILRDAAGNDKYTVSVFGQATAFGMGIGMLLEGGGDDTYEGLWYVQGSAAHTGVTYFGEAAGNDKYNPTFPIAATSIGVGHDCSTSVHYDQGGDDAYRAPGLSLGAGNALGIGILVNAGGNDSFVAGGEPTLGGASWDYYPNESTTLGVFVKAGGPSSYMVGGVTPGPGGASPGGSWGYDSHTDGGAEIGVGADRPAGAASLP